MTEQGKHGFEEGLLGLKTAYIGGGSPNTSKQDLFADTEGNIEAISKVEQQLLNLVSNLESIDANEDTKVQIFCQPVRELPIHKPHAYPCKNTNDKLPSQPSKWPQKPVMLRPTPNQSNSTKIRGIRYAGSSEYQHFPGFCAGCILPINTGAEAPGKSLVIDFESKHFVGTLLMRIKEAPPADKSSQTKKSYFDGKKRKFQAVIKGRFKTELPMSECVTGQEFSRPGGRLPAKWIVSSFIKFVSVLAPQLEATIGGNNPRFLSPLVATAHTVMERKTKDRTDYCYEDLNDEEKERLVNFSVYAGSKDIEETIEEPSATDPESVVNNAVPNPIPDTKSTVSTRQKTRKKIYNQITATKAKEPAFKLSKEYTFEFYQHLLLFGDEFAIDMGRAIGKVSLAPCTDGQPIKFMASHKKADGSLEPLWSFDIWHEALYPYARAYHEENP